MKRFAVFIAFTTVFVAWSPTGSGPVGRRVAFGCLLLSERLAAFGIGARLAAPEPRLNRPSLPATSL